MDNQTLLYLKDGSNKENQSKIYKWEIHFPRLFGQIILHVFSIYGAINFILGGSSLIVVLYFFLIGILSGQGVTMGAHRLWAHRSYKANLRLRIILMVLQTLAFQLDILYWSRLHRIHHMYSDTDADPHNSSRGFFLCHIGWILLKELPEYKSKEKNIDISDLLADKVVIFQKKYYILLVLLIWGIIPIGTAMYFFDICFIEALYGNFIRSLIVLHATLTVNSLAHLFGNKPYDNSIKPRNNSFVSYLTMGEGYHNYHHVFPYDYSTSEFGWKSGWNPATAFIDFFFTIGWATELKKAPHLSIRKKMIKSGEKHGIKKRFKIISFEFIINFLTGIFTVFSPIIFLTGLRVIYFYAFRSD